MKKPPDKFWFPSLLQSATNVKSNSWFDISCKYNPNKITSQSETLKSSYIKTMKFPIYPDDKQKIILDKYFMAVIKMYNITNKYISNFYEKNNYIETFITIRKKLYNDAQTIINDSKINKHILDYSVKHCVEMYDTKIIQIFCIIFYPKLNKKIAIFLFSVQICN